MQHDGGKFRDEQPLRRELRPSGPVTLGLTESRRADHTLISVSGELDILTAPKVGALLDEVIRGRTHDVVVDLRETVFIDSAGLQTLMRAKRRLIRRSRDLTVVISPSGPVERVLELTRLIDALGVVSSLEETKATRPA